jgi:hypothetical protein
MIEALKRQEWGEGLHMTKDNMAHFRLASFASLLNTKLVILSSSSPDYVALDRHFFQESLCPLIERIRVDPNWYLTTYPDVAEAISNRIVADAGDHYRRFGYFEHRMPYQILVQEDWYLDQYSDVKEAVVRRTFTSGQAHFDFSGYREGRVPFPNFELAAV